MRRPLPSRTRLRRNVARRGAIGASARQGPRRAHTRLPQLRPQLRRALPSFGRSRHRSSRAGPVEFNDEQAMASSQVLASILPGALIAGRYLVEHTLGKGGMGSVYAVRDASSKQRYALKYLRRDAALENGPAAALFQREYHTLAHLRHPRVIQVHDYGIDAGRPYYTMELLDGSDL